MSDTDFDNDTDLDDDNRQDDNANLRRLRERAKAADEAEKRAAALERENSFYKAGIPIGDKKMTYFMAGYNGELDPEAIRDAAIEAGFLIEAEKKDDDIPAEEREAHERTADAAQGAKTSEPPGYEDELNAAKSREEVLNVMQKFGKRLHYGDNIIESQTS